MRARLLSALHHGGPAVFKKTRCFPPSGHPEFGLNMMSALMQIFAVSYQKFSLITSFFAFFYIID